MQTATAETEEIEELLYHVFGDSGTESEEADGKEQDIDFSIPRHVSWERNEEIPGIWLCKGLLSSKQQEKLLSAIHSEGWFEDNYHNQAMRFKDLPWWAMQLSKLIYDAACSFSLANDSFDSLSLHPSSQDAAVDLPLNLETLWRFPFFDQLIVNTYQPGEGICAHLDLLRFEDGIAIVSLESVCVMHFMQVEQKTNVSRHMEGASDEQAEHTFAGKQEAPSPLAFSRTKVPVLLVPGDLLLMSGEARYNWAHEIDRSQSSQVWNGEEITQMRRTSVTLRKMVASKQEL